MAKKVSKKVAKIVAKNGLKKTSPKKPAAKLKKTTTARGAKTKKLSVEKASTKSIELSTLLGKTVPNFSLPSTSGEDFNLSKFKGKKVVLYFYPKDSTPGCTLEGQCFSKMAEQFKKLNTVVFGVSRDSMKSHESFKQKQSFQIDLLSDSEELACNIFDVIKEKNMYGKKVMGIVRSTFLIDESGRLVQQWLGVKVEGHAEAVLEAIKHLK